MVAGFERYFQIVRCFRDEDQRADRQPDFTQLDIEMSFVGRRGRARPQRAPARGACSSASAARRSSCRCARIPYDEAIARFGTDRPDLRFGLELTELTDLLAETEFKVFRGVIEAGGIVKGLNAGARDVPRSVLDGLIERAQELGAKGLVWAFREGEGWRSPTAKFLSDAELAALNERLGAEEGDLLLVVADKPDGRQLGARPAAPRPRRALRAHRSRGGGVLLGHRVADVRLERGRGALGSAPSPVHRARPASSTPTDPGAARALAYDVVWNGQELGGGSIRISDPELQQRGAGGDRDRRRRRPSERFGFLLEALRYGAPPHGGIAYGLDRIVQRLVHADSIRDVIAFPKAASGADPLTGAPAPGRRGRSCASSGSRCAAKRPAEPGRSRRSAARTRVARRRCRPRCPGKRRDVNASPASSSTREVTNLVGDPGLEPVALGGGADVLLVWCGDLERAIAEVLGTAGGGGVVVVPASGADGQVDAVDRRPHELRVSGIPHLERVEHPRAGVPFQGDGNEFVRA